MCKNILKISLFLLYINVISILNHQQCNAADQLQIEWGWQVTAHYRTEAGCTSVGKSSTNDNLVSNHVIVFKHYMSPDNWKSTRHRLEMPEALLNARTKEEPGVLASRKSLTCLFGLPDSTQDLNAVFYHRSACFLPQSNLKAAEPSSLTGKLAIKELLRIHEDTQDEINHLLSLGKVRNVKAKLEQILQDTPWMSDNQSVLRLRRIVEMYEEKAFTKCKEQLTQLTRRFVFEGQDEDVLQSIHQILEGFNADHLQILEAHRQTEQQKAEAALARFLQHPQMQVLELNLRRELAGRFLNSGDM